MTKPRGRREELRVGAIIECDLGEIAVGVRSILMLPPAPDRLA